MFGNFVRKNIPKRDSIVAGIDVEDSTLAVFLTTSSSLTSSVVGLTTLEDSSSSTSQTSSQSTSTLKATKTVTAPKQTITSTQLVTSTSSVQKPSPTTSSPPPPPPPPPPPQPQPQPQPQSTSLPSTSPTRASPPPPPPPPASLASPPPPPPTAASESAPQETPEPPIQEIINPVPVNLSPHAGPTAKQEQLPTSILPTVAIPTALEDLPVLIGSPTSTIPVSVPLLVATSSTPAVVLISPTHPTQILPSNPPIASETALPKMPGMTAGGKVSAIFGVVLFLGAACLMYQLYYKKKRQTEKASRLRDNEKQNFGSSGMASTDVSKISSQQNTCPKPIVGLSFNPASEKNFSQESHRANPFGKHAEVLVDPINASGPNVIEKVGSEQSIVTRGPLKNCQSVSRSVTGELMGNLRSNDKTETVSPAPTSPQEMSTNATVQPPTRPASGVYRVQLDFTPSMNDELELRSGQLIRVLHEFDDGWAMCIRLDRSEQGVCPRTCLSPRPLKPKTPSTSPSGRIGAQVPQDHFPSLNPKEFAPLPMLPTAQIGSGQRTPPSVTAGCNPNTKTPPSTKNNMNPSQQASGNCDQLPTVLPLKNVARYVSLTLPKTEGPISHSISELSGSPTPVDDYFSFSKPSDDPVIKHKNSTQLPSPTSLNMGGEIGIPAHYLSEKPLSQKPVPGQAL